MRVALVNEGTYPVAAGGVSTWCDQLVRGLPEHEFTLLTLVGGARDVVWPLPDNVTGTRLVPMWDPAARSRRRRGRRAREAATLALEGLWGAVLPGPGDVAPSTSLGLAPQATQTEVVEACLRLLAAPTPMPLLSVLTDEGSVRPILEAWARHRLAHPALPELTLSQAGEAALLVDRCLAVLDCRWPSVDLVHVASNGPAALVALARLWREGTPYILTEHGVYLRERYLALGAAGLSWPVRYVVMAFLRTLGQIVYANAELILPVSEFNGRWERRLGADGERVAVIHNGVDPRQHAVVDTEPDVPTICFVGRIDPLKDLHTLVDAFALVRQRVPDARLRMFGPTPSGNEGYRRSVEARIAALGLQDAAVFEGAVPSSRVASEAGHVVALSSISEGLPFTVMEAMMHGRATVSTDVGGVSEVVGPAECGTVVPPRDPRAMAAGLVGYLTDDDRRRSTGLAARRRAVDLFTQSRFTERHRLVYAMFDTSTNEAELEAAGRAGAAPADPTAGVRAAGTAPRAAAPADRAAGVRATGTAPGTPGAGAGAA